MHIGSKLFKEEAETRHRTVNSKRNSNVEIQCTA